VSADVIAELGAGGYLINVARGSAVDGEALTRALQSRAIAGAALDVFATEPCFPEELCALENVVLLPHIGTATHETRAAMGDSSSTTFIRSLTPGASSRPYPRGAEPNNSAQQIRVPRQALRRRRSLNASAFRVDCPRALAARRPPPCLQEHCASF